MTSIVDVIALCAWVAFLVSTIGIFTKGEIDIWKFGARTKRGHFKEMPILFTILATFQIGAFIFLTLMFYSMYWSRISSSLGLHV